MRSNRRSVARSAAAPASLLAAFATCLACSTTPALPRATGPGAPSPQWWRQATFYEIFVRSFADSDGDGVGDLAGLTARLDSLNDGDPSTTFDLGVTGLWLMPIQPAASYHGYDVTDYTAVNPAYGDLAAFEALLAAAHARGIRVIIDFVLNHTSSQHPWFVEASTGPRARFRDHYLWRSAPPEQGFERPWDGASTWHRGAGDDLYYGLFYSGMPDLDLTNPAVEAKMIDAMRFWLDLGVDGFRVDAVRYLVETEDGVVADTAETHALLRRIRAALQRHHPDVLLVGEAWTSLEGAATYHGAQSDEVHLTFGFELAGAILTAVKDGARVDLRRALKRAPDAYRDLAGQAPFLTNHDMPRVMRALGGDRAKMRVAAATLFAMVGTPFVYYGEELGMQGGATPKDEDKRTPLPWDPSPHRGFTSGTPWIMSTEVDNIDLETQRDDPSSLWSLYRRLIALRGSRPSLTSSALTLPDVRGGGRGLLVLLRGSKERRTLVVINYAPGDTGAFTVDLPGVPSVLLQEGLAAEPTSQDGALRFPGLGPRGFAYLDLR